MDDTSTVILFALAMLIGCYLAGLIPLVVSLSEARLQLVTVMGAGLLVGTALAVIIPEGVNAIIVSQGKALAAVTQAPPGGTSSHHHHHQSGPELHSMVGLALVAGFVLMLLVDQCTHRHSAPAEQSSDPEGGVRRTSGTLTATVGLVVHAAADGVALGAAVASSRTDVELIVFVAIMLHKAPAAFGLVTFLLHEGLERVRVRRHLLIFSLAAPVLAVVTFFSIGQGGGEALSQTAATGLCLLFSAGTFLYVSTVHVLPEVMSRSGGGRFSPAELLSLIAGCLFPVLLSLNHHH